MKIANGNAWLARRRCDATRPGPWHGRPTSVSTGSPRFGAEPVRSAETLVILPGAVKTERQELSFSRQAQSIRLMENLVVARI